MLPILMVVSPAVAGPVKISPLIKSPAAAVAVQKRLNFISFSLWMLK
jgi:hypothetical protein